MKIRLITILFILILSGCGYTHRQRFEAFSASFQQGHYCQAIDVLLGGKNVCSASPDYLFASDYDLDVRLNAGTSLFLANRPDLSHIFLESAATDIRQTLNISGIGRDSAEVITNASVMDYNPMIMDSIYVHVYETLNALRIKDKQEAKIQIQRAHEAQVNAIAAYISEIEKQRAETYRESAELDEAQVSRNTRTTHAVMQQFRPISHFKGYADFVNPYMNYLSGLFYLVNGDTASDRENAVHEFKKVDGMIGNNLFVKHDLSLAERKADRLMKNIPPTIWVIFENGMVPCLREFRIDLPAFLVTNSFHMASLALPVPEERAEAYPYITVSNGNTRVRTQILTSVDNIFMGEYNKKLPSMISKAVAKLAVQTMAQIIAQQQLGDWGGIAVALYSVMTTTADIRSWYSLPKNIQLAKVQKTNDGTVTLHIGGNPVHMNTNKDGHTLIYVRVPSAGIPPVIQIIDL